MSPEPATVFIIDDDASIRTALERLCRSAGLNGRSFASVDEFLAVEIDSPDACVVSDICMPGSQGIVLPRLLRERGLDLPVIFITAYDTPEAREEAKHAGAAAYFRKPVDHQALLDTIAWAVQNPVTVT